MTSAARVAVIIPCYDDGVLLEEAVASVQEDEPVEIVVVDDGSTDAETLAILEELGGRGTRVVRRENGGLAEARATGLGATSAPFVYPLDADDLLEPGALAAMADALERNPDAAVVWGDYELFGDGKGRYRSPDRWLPWTLTYVNPYPVSSLLRREPLERAKDWRGAPGAKVVGAHGYEDWDLWLRFVGMGLGGVRVDRAVYRRRLHGTSRLLVGARRNHQTLYAELVERNAAVFAMRDELRRRERPSAWKRAAYPVLFGPRKYVPFPIEAFLQRTMMRLGTGLPG
jgi:glycosyltransferase involved in cell wall biosynthesis